MAKKKKDAKNQQSVAAVAPLLGRQPMKTNANSQSIILRPTNSPYASYPAQLSIGPKHTAYYVPQDYLRNLDSITSCDFSGGAIYLPDVDESTGHVLVHYLYTGLYQTLDDIEPSLALKANIEFKRAFLAYKTANKYGVFGLEQLAKHKIEHFGAKLNFVDVIDAVKEHSSKRLCDNSWFHNYLVGRAKIAFEEDHTVFGKHNFFDGINDVALAKVMAKCAVELYNEKVSRMLNKESGPNPANSEDCAPDAQVSTIEEAQPEEFHAIKETPTEGCSDPGLYTEEYPALDYPKIDLPPEKLPPEEATVEEPATIEDPVTSTFTPAELTPRAEEQEESTAAEEMIYDSIAPEPAEEEKKDEDWSDCVLKSEEDANPPMSPGDLKPEVESPKDVDDACDWESSSAWIGGWNRKKDKRKGPEPVADDTVVGNDHSHLKAKLDVPIEAEGQICPVRAKHLIGDEWRNCKQCRAMLHQVAIQLASAGRADEVLMKRL